MRQKFIAGNWKMFTTTASARALAEAIAKGVGTDKGVRVAVCPPFPYLSLVADIVKGSRVELGAQNLYPEKEGAFTGEVSPTMLLDVGCRLVILGHSERRHKMGETDEFINRKVHAALAAGLEVILCVGETLAERQGNQTESVLRSQLTSGLQAVAAQDMSRLVIAYEPVWAIGTGQVATTEQAQEAHAFIRSEIAKAYGPAIAQAQIIQYGGSAKPENVSALLHQPDVDGGLIGGASLQAESFLKIIRLAHS